MADFGAYIRRLREQRRLSLRDVAARTGMSYSYVAQVEQGKRNPPGPQRLKRLAAVYGVPVRSLLKAAGYLDDADVTGPVSSSENEVNRAFEFVINDPAYDWGTRITGEITTDVKRFVVEMYEKSTGKKLLTGD